MRGILPTLFVMTPLTLIGQFNLDATTSAFAAQRERLNSADSLYLQGQKQSACNIYYTLLMHYPKNWRFILRSIRCISNIESSNIELIKYLYTHGISSDSIATDVIIGPKLSAELSQTGGTLFPESRYSSMLDSIAIVDQQVRSGRVSESEMIRTDSLHYQQLIRCFRDTGQYINSRASILVLTHSLSLHPNDIPYVVALLNEALLNGSIDPETYALIVDHTFYGIFRCVPFGVFGSDKVKLPRCVEDHTTELYRTRLLGAQRSDMFAK